MSSPLIQMVGAVTPAVNVAGRPAVRGVAAWQDPILAKPTGTGGPEQRPKSCVSTWPTRRFPHAGTLRRGRTALLRRTSRIGGAPDGVPARPRRARRVNPLPHRCRVVVLHEELTSTLLAGPTRDRDRTKSHATTVVRSPRPSLRDRTRDSTGADFTDRKEDDRDRRTLGLL